MALGFELLTQDFVVVDLPVEDEVDIAALVRHRVDDLVR